MGRDEATGFGSALAAWDAAFVAGDIDALIALMADDIELMLHEEPTIAGKASVAEVFRGLFSTVDTSAYIPDHHTVEVHDNAAYVLSEFTEDLLPYDGSEGLRVSGRTVLFYRRQGEKWLVTRALSARTAPDKPITQ